jgi:hypothetical protein
MAVPGRKSIADALEMEVMNSFHRWFCPLGPVDVRTAGTYLLRPVVDYVIVCPVDQVKELSQQWI